MLCSLARCMGTGMMVLSHGVVHRGGLTVPVTTPHPEHHRSASLILPAAPLSAPLCAYPQPAYPQLAFQP